MPRAGVEPARPNEHMALNHACLPIPAPGQIFIIKLFIKKFNSVILCTNSSFTLINKRFLELHHDLLNIIEQYQY